MTRQPIPLPPAREPSLTTKRGHIKAVYLTREQLSQIIQNMRDGMDNNAACHAVGTSHTQFVRRLWKEPDLLQEINDMKRERRRQKPTVESEA
jgi:hypothetical protein